MTEVKRLSSCNFVKQHLLNQINNIKVDIQELLDKRKGITNKTEISNIDAEKQILKDKLKALNDKLKDLNSKQRDDNRKNNTLKSIIRDIDSIEFNSIKRSDTVAMERAKLSKIERDVSMMKFMESQKIQEIYSQLDSDKYPAALFLHKDIINSYGLCPYLETPFVQNILKDETEYESIFYEKENLEKGRIEWLQSKDDNGKLYYNIYDNVYLGGKNKDLNDEYELLDTEIRNYIKSILTSSQLEYFDNSEKFIKEYISSNIKTKRLKERFKTMINWLSILNSETSIDINKYFSERYNIQLVVNIVVNKTNRKIDKIEKNNRSLNIEKFENYIEKIVKLKDDISKNETYCKNIIKNLKSDLVVYLTDKETFSKNNNFITIDLVKVTQTGKYFKKWSVLTDQEKIERLESFSEFYIDKYLVHQNVVYKNQRDIKIKELQEILSQKLKDKKLPYKILSWNVKNGTIETIKNLKYINHKFYINDPLSDNEHQEKEQNANCENTPSVNESESVNEIIQKKKGKKVSTKTIVTNDFEKIINEEMLLFILKKVNSNMLEVKDEDKEIFIQRIKTILKIKKIPVGDKNRIFEKYDEMFDLVTSNR